MPAVLPSQAKTRLHITQNYKKKRTEREREREREREGMERTVLLATGRQSGAARIDSQD